MPKAPLDNTLDALYATIIERRQSNDSDSSYVAKLAKKGRHKICQKLGEEAVETVIEGVADKKKAVVSESSDLLFHLLMLWADMGIKPDDIAKELIRRQSISGIEEKKNRKL
ncbi:MAG: phosphoribosyl-ATP diphosphatase [Alphaproteobacteria bacterium]|nr:phosphoribosyl-ATP diphosphatase [Alphaproteobacteria bacterium]